eukprot:CAMPEP_0178987104 /NCGR_PEP_ID=MMETSP0795-20121207/3073_1 /TAXON_ID=88552 /ORGANISM="Amoebophrya sp., Strain Ameob2" /LENGTH=102 /DNA_ID=CAMNT_0020678237 /DNA_START=40 /DNA_END=348 /DNA_ORIENTATION=+
MPGAALRLLEQAVGSSTASCLGDPSLTNANVTATVRSTKYIYIKRGSTRPYSYTTSTSFFVPPGQPPRKPGKIEKPDPTDGSCRNKRDPDKTCLIASLPIEC